MNIFFRFFFFTLIILFLDQVSKIFILSQVDLPWWLVPQHIGFDLVYNSGVAFSLPIVGVAALLLGILLSFLILIFSVRYSRRTFLSDFTFSLILGGAMGNIVDRVRLQSVVDFISIYSYPTFNLADIFIVIGVFLLLLFYSRIIIHSKSFTSD